MRTIERTRVFTGRIKGGLIVIDKIKWENGQESLRLVQRRKDKWIDFLIAFEAIPDFVQTLLKIYKDYGKIEYEMEDEPPF